MKKRLSSLVVFLVVLQVISQPAIPQQVEIDRISQMPDFPQPYLMRDWQRVAQRYDSLVYDASLGATHLPLIEFAEGGVNYPEDPAFGLHTYVGTSSPGNWEAINVLPSVIGASLCGIDKSNQFGQDFVLMCQDWFNSANGQGVYLNNRAGSSGNDWWYDVMPNVFFYQLNSLYPLAGDFPSQFTRVADRWLEAVRAMGADNVPWTIPDMDYRAWDLLSMEGLRTGVHEPEAAGALAWILYAAYSKTGDLRYRHGAEWCMEFLNSLDTNPSYELQLSYGAYTAFRMNAELGTSYDADKILNWCFDIGPLRNWGAILGSFGELDCHGLVGEQASGGTAYGFTMNGFQQAAALLPLLRYNDHYARALGKWLLNLANASRLFYADFLPGENQDGADWSGVYDPGSVIAYEALKESYDGFSPYATGDAIRGGWAETNLALYGSSHVGMLGGIIRKTSEEGILQTDLCKTDYYAGEAYPSLLYYNPHETAREVILDLETVTNGICDLYESCSNRFLAYDVSGEYLLEIPAGEARIVVLVPAGAEITEEFDHRLANGVVIDYQSGKGVGNYPPRIKALASADSLVLSGGSLCIHCTAADPEGGGLQYSWYGENVPNESGQWSDEAVLQWQAPGQTGSYDLKCVVQDEGGLTDSLELTLLVVEHIVAPPVIEELSAESRKLHPGTTTGITCFAVDPNLGHLYYEWSAEGEVLSDTAAEIRWTAPEEEGVRMIKCRVLNQDSLWAEDSLSLLVRDSAYTQQGTLVGGYALDGDALDFSYYGNHGTAFSMSWVPDPLGVTGSAAAYNGSSSVIRIPHGRQHDFTEGITLSCFINPGATGGAEQFLVSHGSWQNRWKLSITGSRLRFTLNGSGGIADLDSESELQEDVWQQVVALYNGKDMEIWLDGDLDSFKPFSGTLKTSEYDLTLGQMLPGDFQYGYQGAMDHLRIYNYGVDSETLGKIFSGELTAVEDADGLSPFVIFPNPSAGMVNIRFSDPPLQPLEIGISDSHGRMIWRTDSPDFSGGAGVFALPLDKPEAGIYFIYIRESGKLHTRKLVIY